METRNNQLMQMYGRISEELRALSATNRDIINRLMTISAVNEQTVTFTMLHNIYCRNMQLCATYNAQINTILNAIVHDSVINEETVPPPPPSMAPPAPAVNIRTTYYRPTQSGLVRVGSNEQHITAPTSTVNSIVSNILSTIANAATIAPDNAEIVTPEQINAAVHNTLYGEIENPINSECSITHEPFEPTTEVSQIRHCGHIFGRTDLAHWLQRSCRCPICRYDIRGGGSSDGGGGTSMEENEASNRLYSLLLADLLNDGRGAQQRPYIRRERD